MSTGLHLDLEDLSPDELAQGFRAENGIHVCAVCGVEFTDGVIYTVEGGPPMMAELACRTHVEAVHGGMLSVLTGLPESVSGLTGTQRVLVQSMAEGLSDQQIARRMGGKAASTIRNHRFQHRRRVSEAKVLVAIASLLDAGDQADSFIQFHPSIPVQDDRIVTTREEAARILDRVLVPGEDLVLGRFPRKEKEKLVVLRRISQEFRQGRTYSEKEVNEIISAIYPDYVTVRRYLVDYRFLTRTANGSSYWVPGERDPV